MNKEALTGTVAVVATTGTLALFLPKYGDAWDAIPGHDAKFNANLRMGEIGFGALAVSVGVLQSLASGSAAPFVASAFLTAFFIGMYELAYKAIPTKVELQ